MVERCLVGSLGVEGVFVDFLPFTEAGGEVLELSLAGGLMEEEETVEDGALVVVSPSLRTNG